MNLIEQAVKMAQLGPRRWIGREYQTCLKCTSSIFYVDSGGAIHCRYCQPPKLSEIALLLELVPDFRTNYSGVLEEADEKAKKIFTARLEN